MTTSTHHRFLRPILFLVAVPVASVMALAQERNSRGYPLTPGIWPERAIQVCWDVDDSAFRHYAARREGVRRAIRDSWEAHSAVRFVGWQQCTGAPNGGISIAIRDENPHVKALGSRLRNVPAGVVLNFEYRQFPCPYGEEGCDRVFAIHEFGHVLSFAHEQNRTDTPESCSHPQGTHGDVVFGAWDLHSIMNYCNPDWSGNTSLSPTDMAMVRYYYGIAAGLLQLLLD